ncbi:hypothetical protein [Neorhizobium galegae]|uniref:hypothetical protein n=1 Tax=Neorhizobium galegae TaxID=399 RepID=UPI0021051B23|nr:hypothetical protein [Neorhizobium galegae]MCQ1854908.1 hypothetical protein [Neorhizobium galegae]
MLDMMQVHSAMRQHVDMVISDAPSSNEAKIAFLHDIRRRARDVAPPAIRAPDLLRRHARLARFLRGLAQ